MSAHIWVVEQGEYSDYRVVGVFSSLANARLVADAVGSDASVAEWPLDPAVAELNQGHKQFIVNMRRDGTVERCHEWEVSGYELTGACSIWRRTQAPFYRGKPDIHDVLQGKFWAADAEHAVKIANEKRTQMIANGEWA